MYQRRDSRWRIFKVERSGKKELLLLCVPNLKRRAWDTANGQRHTSTKKNHFWDRFLVDDTLTPAR